MTSWAITTKPTIDTVEQLDCYTGQTKDAIILIREVLSSMRSHDQNEVSVEYSAETMKLSIIAKR